MSGSSGSRPPGDGSGGEGSPSGEEAMKTKGKSKSKMGAFKSLREASRSGSFRIGGRKKSADEGSADSLAGEASEAGKKGKKKRSDEESSAAQKVSEEKEGGALAEGVVPAKKKKKKKGSSLVRKLSSKYRNRLSSAEAAKRVDTLTEETDVSLSLTEAAAVSLPDEEEEDDLRSVGSGISTATGSTGGGTQSRASDNHPPPASSLSLSGPTMSSSASSSASVGTPPSGPDPSPDSTFAPTPPKEGRSSPGSVSPIRSYLPIQTPSSSFPTTFPLYYKPPQTSSIVRRSVTPPFQSPSASHGGRGEASSPVWGGRPRGPLGLSIKTREHEEVVTYSFSSTIETKETEKNSGNENVGGAEGPKLASTSSESTGKVEKEGEEVCGGEERIAEEAPPTAADAEQKDSQEASLLRSDSEATVEKCSKVEVVEEEQGKGAGEEGKEEGVTVEKEEEVEGEVGEVTQDSGEVSGEATVEQPLEESSGTGAQGVERGDSPPRGQMDEGPETSTALASGGGGASGASGGGVMVPGAGSKREHLYKILVIGELGTGKTSIIKRYVHQFFSQHYRATIGVDFALKVINWDADTIIRLQLWDIAGQERFGNMTRVYYKEAVGAFIVFDVTRSATFESVVKWKVDLDSKVQLPDGSPIPCVLLANKCDQQKEGIVNNPAKMEEYCKEKGFSGWYETSAKENINIEEAARFLVTKILKNDRLTGVDPSKDSERFALDGSGAGMNGNGVRGGNGRQEGKSCAC